MSACRKIDTTVESSFSSDIYRNESLILSESQPNSSDADTNVNNISSTENTSTNNKNTSHTAVGSNVEEGSNTTQTPDDKDTSYNDIVCTKIINFSQVGFSVKGSNTLLYVTIPKEWTLKNSDNGYSILKNSQTIGNVSTLAKSNDTSKAVNVFYTEITTGDIKVTHSIDRITSGNSSSYLRTLCYNYDDASGNRKSISLTFNYQEIDSSAAYKMITEVKTNTATTNSNLGLLRIEDERNKVLILGNSFINSSGIGSILQTMCGNEVYVEAHSRGYAHVGTYTNDADMMQKIRGGNYSVVFICGLYDHLAVSDLKNMISVCEESNTKLAVFPAHNENQEKIEHAISLYPDTIFLNWKEEIDNLISTGIDISYFCIPDAHNHSTPLAGYVGAHMIYRAIFNKIPETTEFIEVSKSQIDLLGEYVKTGSIVLLDKNSSYVIE